MKSSIRKGLMYVTVAVGKIQGKSRFTVAEGEWRNSTVGVVPLLNQPKLFLKLRVIYVFVIQKSKHP